VRPWATAEVRQSARLIVSMSAIWRVGACKLVDWGVPSRQCRPDRPPRRPPESPMPGIERAAPSGAALRGTGRPGGLPAAISSAPAMTGFGSRSTAVGHQGRNHEHDVHGQYHLMPAPRDRAIVARSDTAMVKRARFAFTAPTLWLCTCRSSTAAGRSPGGDPWLCVPVSRRVCPGRWRSRKRPSFPARNVGGPWSRHHDVMVLSGTPVRVSVRAHQPRRPGRSGPRPPAVRDRASRPRSRSRPRGR
jgi:hypothetical protein